MQAGLHLCCLHAIKLGFLTLRPKYFEWVHVDFQVCIVILSMNMISFHFESML